MLDRDYTECDEWHANVLDLVTSMHPDQVIVTQASGYTPADAGDQDPADVILDGYVRVLDTLAAATPSVVVLSDTPYPAGDVPDCLSAHLDDASACTSTHEHALAHRLTDVEREAADRAARPPTSPPTTSCAVRPRCPVIVGNLLVYRDNSHLSTPYVRWLAPELVARLGAPWVATDGDG